MRLLRWQECLLVQTVQGGGPGAGRQWPNAHSHGNRVGEISYTAGRRAKRMYAADGAPAGAGGTGQAGGDAHGTGQATTAGGGDAILIAANRRGYEAPKPDMAGAEIKEMAGAVRRHALVLAAGDPGGSPGRGSAARGDDHGEYVETVCARAVHGGDGAARGPVSRAAAPADLPPKLREHMAVLEGRGYKVEAIDNGEIGIVIKDYKIPGRIWSRETADLRLSTDSAYPETKIGAFWLCPPVSRRNGDTIRGAGSTVWQGRTWQTFCWYVVHWDPRHDNLLTHLDVVDDRMWRDE